MKAEELKKDNVHRWEEDSLKAMYEKGFKAGQLAEREKCLKMIEEVYEDEPVYVQEVEKIINRIFDKITKKIKEMKE